MASFEDASRRVVTVPGELLGQDLKLSLGSIGDYDETYFNGVPVGGVGSRKP